MLLKMCSKCVARETKPGLKFVDAPNLGDECLICSDCIGLERDIDWKQKERELKEIIKSSGAACIVDANNTKDGLFTALYIKDNLGLTPLCVRTKPLMPSYLYEKNAKLFKEKHGLDVFYYSLDGTSEVPEYSKADKRYIDPKTTPGRKAIVNLIKKEFVEKGSFSRYEYLLSVIPTKMALNYQIPLVFRGLRPTHTEKQIIPESILQEPAEMEIQKAELQTIYLSDYIKWDDTEIGRKVNKQYGLEIFESSQLAAIGGYWQFDLIDSELEIVSKYLQFTRLKYGRATEQACSDIRLGHITRDQGLGLSRKYDGHIDLDIIQRFIDLLGIKRDDWTLLANKFRYDESVRIQTPEVAI